jgi:hypothetical protein
VQELSINFAVRAMATPYGPGQGVPDEDLGPVILGATLTVTLAALITIATRLYVRLLMIRNVGWDDYVMISAMLLVSHSVFIISVFPIVLSLEYSPRSRRYRKRNLSTHGTTGSQVDLVGNPSNVYVRYHAESLYSHGSSHAPLQYEEEATQNSSDIDDQH